jgi:CrcB protein
MGVNVAGCFAIGALSVLLGRNAQGAAVAESWRVFWLSGVLGGFTTWSAFALESVLLTSEGASMKALAYVLLTVMGCLLAAWIGRSVGLAMSG